MCWVFYFTSELTGEGDEDEVKKTLQFSAINSDF